ncbi:MAG: ABC transporter ATP-binding protein [Alsobacter sp.]
MAEPGPRSGERAGARSVAASRRGFAPWRDPSALPLIRFEAVRKSFGGIAAVDGVTLNIHEREFFCLLGPSGCGKTTLMRMVAGFETPDAGRILLGGQDLAALPPHRRPVNMMFQSYALFPHMSVEANVAFGLKQDGLPRDEIAARVAAMLRLVQLTGLERRRPDQLSGGQRQRVALARALVKRPKVLLLDEPLGALDKKLREETQFELMDLQVELGTTFIMVTHDQDEAMAMADRIAMMERGRLVQVGTPPEIYEAPATREVAAFVGDITLFDGCVAEHAGGTVEVDCPAVGARLAVATDRPVRAGEAVCVGVRPEKLSLWAQRPGDAPNVLEGVVWDIGYLGDWTLFRVRLATGATVKVARPNAGRQAGAIAWEDRVWLTFEPAAAVLLAG